MRRAIVAPLCLTVGLLLAVGCASDTKAAVPGSPASGTAVVAPGSAAPGTTVAVQKDVLSSDVDPPGAAGRTLTLIRYTIAPGAKLAAHVHPGVQLASIESGTLTYTVDKGTATVRRATGATESATAPTVITLGPGDAVTEKGDMVHFGANATDRPVVILATLLTVTGEELAVRVPAP